MIGISKWIKDKNLFEIDGHIHLFNKDKVSKTIESAPLSVGFIDIEPKFIESYQSTMSYYDNYISNHYDESKTILLASSTNADEMIEMHKKWPNIIKGFGEIKCYAEWKGKELNLDKLSKYWPVFKYASENDLPIYIHFSLYDINRVKRLTSLLKRYPKVKVVLCHCGMDEFTEDKEFAFYSVLNLMDRFSNLYTDISYTALDYFSTCPMKLLKFKSDRILTGTDLNQISEDKKEENVSKINKVLPYFDNTFNIKKLFNLL